MRRALFRRRRQTADCLVRVEHSARSLEAHVELLGDPEIGPGDRVRVTGAAISVRFGERLTLAREAEIVRAGALEAALVRLLSRLQLRELHEVSFSSGSRL